MIEQDNIEILIFKYLQGNMSGEDRERLNVWLEDEENRRVFTRLVDKHRIMAKMERMDEYDWQKSWSRLEGKLPGRKRLEWRRWVVAASLLGVVALGTWKFAREQRDVSTVVMTEKIEPGKPLAELVLPGGKVVELHKDSIRVFSSGNGVALRNEDGILSFSGDAVGDVPKSDYSEVRTPRGGEYQVVLPDGSIVWLNAESKLRFPVVFSEGERRVWASGELYFQVAKDSLAPFRVEVEDAYEVEVLGTEFNVRAYANLTSATTLVRGNVLVRDKASEVRLIPGQQVLKKSDGSGLVVKEVDVTPYVAWKEGYFLFEDERLEDILNELSRWYNVDVFFENQSAREERFSVDIRRHDDFEEVLRLIERTGTVKMTIKGNRIFVK